MTSFAKEAQELTPENLQKLLKLVSATIEVRPPRNDWYMMIPWRPCSKNVNPREFPFCSLGLMNLMTYNWMNSVVYRIYKKKNLDVENIFYAPYEERAHSNRQRMEKLWKHEQEKNGQAGLNKVLTKHCFALLMASLILQFLSGIVSLICPTVIFRWLLEYAQSKDTDMMYGMVLVLQAFSFECLRCFLHTGSMSLSILCAGRLKAGFMSFLYRKILFLRGMQGHTVGELINLFANDSQRLFDLCLYVPSLFVAPFLVASALVYCTLYIGPWCLIGTIFILIHFIYQITISKANSYIRARTISATDKRVQLTADLLASIRNIKLNVWEDSFEKRISSSRKHEEDCLKRAAYIQMASIAVIPLVTLVSLVTIFGGYIGFGTELLPAQAFVIMSVYNLIRTTTILLPSMIRNWSDFKLGLKRAERLLKMEEVDFTDIARSTKNPDHAVEVEGATFAWIRIDGFRGSQFLVDGYFPVLKDIQFNVQKGKMVAICGNIGSGKSSLLSALVGQLKLVKGTAAVQGRVGYVKQEAWIFHGTVRENILFGSSFDEKWYRATVFSCYLTQDFKSLPQGDETLIGERGLNLSDGQKQRIGLARAIYADPDILLLDDPLRAVDPNACQFLFNNCLKKAAEKGKTVIFNTHSLQYLYHCDEVFFLKKGHIVKRDTHEFLMKSDADYKASIIRSIDLFEMKKEEEFNELLSGERMTSNATSNDLFQIADDVEDDLREEEFLPSKSVQRSTYLVYMRSIGGKSTCLAVVATFLLSSFSIFLSDFWLSSYLRRCEDDAPSVDGYSQCKTVSLTVFMVVYVLGAGFSIVLFALRGYLFVKASITASAVIHARILSKLLVVSMSFFDDTSPGKILGTISSGMDGIDVRLPMQVEMLLENVSSVVVCVISVTVTFPAFLTFAIVVVIIVYVLQNICRLVTRQLKIAESLTKSPMYGHVVSTTQGLETIQAFKKMSDFNLKFESLVDNHVTCLMMLVSYTRWLGFRLEMLAIVFTSITAFLVVITKEQVQVSYAGLAIVYASQLNRLLRNTIRYIADTEARFTSVERIDSFIKNTREEGPFINEKKRPPSDWPYRGHIHFEKFGLRYGPNHPWILTGITCDINPEEKVGIIGRTGSGKSSLTAALFRLVGYTEGTITIDGIDISTVGLYDLRSRLSIVPQDPLLFLGSLRHNLDPMGAYTDEELWKALEICYMKKRVMRLNHGLDAHVVEKGSNFSTGERQLFCLARAFLKHSKIMILDEVTSSADPETDRFIQTIIERTFADCTILTIAHKTETLLKCDRIMVIENGMIAQYDTPEVIFETKALKLNLVV